ncbi:MAG: hypothetical protein CO035_02025 [Candidatus Omnitrophica bacterium CG_4_9_14_0_2_um_filter_42_8]|nr:MAG: hypothetical protein CO035_02025 [Candidatus Omnitrophica bacterium CG_4_9_14_0_2_um_filter_42_8]
MDGIDISSDSWVTSGKIADGAVATADLTDSAVTAAKIGVGAVEKSKILELRPYATTPTADNKVNVAAGIISVANNAKINFAGAISPAFDPVTADSRIDLLTINSTGALVIVPGTQAVTPAAPTYPTDKLAIAEVTVTETAVQGVSISASDILDVRPFLNLSSGSGNSSITTTDSVIFTIGTNTDETANNVSLAFGNTAGGQKSIIYQGASSDDFVFNDDISLGANSLKFTTNTLTDTKVGNYDSHLLNTSNPHSVTAAQIGGTGIVSEINAVGTSGAINASRLAAEVLTQTEGDTRYLTPVKTVFTAEYPNAIMYGDGIGNSGTMAVKNTGDANWRNYYEWSSQNTVLQDYTVSVRYELPQDFAGWALANAIKLGYITQTAINADNKADVTIYRAGSVTAIASSVANYSASWSEIVIDDSELGSWSAGDVMIMEIKAYSKNSNFTRVGDITLNYTR